MERQHEQSIIDVFKEIFKLKCKELKSEICISASLDGQDNWLGADYLFSSDAKFVLIEFKYEKKNIKDEKNKLLRKCLCESFQLGNEKFNENKFNKHIQCHFISWSEKSNNERGIFIGNYAGFVCFPVFDIKTPCEENPPKEEASIFIEDFILSNQKIGLEFDDFNSYIEWLLKVCPSSCGGPVELIIHHPKNPIKLLEFNNLNELNDFILELNRNNLNAKFKYSKKNNKPKF